MSRYCLSALPELDAAIRKAERVLVATDFDGTLCPIARTPHDVRLSPAVMEIVRRMAECERLHLAVLSGRSLADISQRLPPGLTVSGNHGLEIQGGNFQFEHEAARELRPRLEWLCAELEQVMAPWPGAWVENKGLSATLHYREVDAHQHGPMLFAARRHLTRDGGFALRAGKRALEIRPKIEWDKREAVRYISEAAGPFDVTICLGDDRTDETMYEPVEGRYSVKVGCDQPTRAAYYLLDPGEVAILLTHVLDLCETPVLGQVAHAAMG